jgi:hypothetical protein
MKQIAILALGFALHDKNYGISGPMAYCGYSERKEDSLVEDL